MRTTEERSMHLHHVRHPEITLDGLRVAYREAGPPDAPVVLLLHGFPSSSFSFRQLMPALADQFRVVAPDLPGFGFSDVPPRARGALTFDRLADTVAAFVRALGAAPAAVYLHDYGAQVGFRLLVDGRLSPTRVIVQNSEAYLEPGRTAAWRLAEAFWADPSPARRDALRDALLTEPGVRREFEEQLPAALRERIDPAVVRLAADHLRRDGVVDAMLDLHRDYPSNVAHYARVQAYLRERAPRCCVVWGRRDQYYTEAQAAAYGRDVPSAEVHLLDGGHWLLETHGPEVASIVRTFLVA
jgi:pimeloyl-ACP methyl ester carboxylesterase